MRSGRWLRAGALAACGLSLWAGACNSRMPVLDSPIAPTAVSGAPVPSPAVESTILQVDVRPRAVLGAGSATGTVSLTLPAPPGGLSVTLSSGDAAVSVPASVIVPAGLASASFPVTAAAVPADRQTTLDARVAQKVVHAPFRLWALLPMFFSFVSEPGDFIGQGSVRRIVPEEMTFSGFCSGSEVRLTMSAQFETWNVWLGAPAGQPLAVGTYEGATRTAFRAPGTPGIDISGAGRGCNRTVGAFIVREADYTASGQIRQFWATFEQQCEGNPAPMRGDIRVTNLPPVPPPSGSVACMLP
jgi:hypothetical protein